MILLLSTLLSAAMAGDTNHDAYNVIFNVTWIDDVAYVTEDVPLIPSDDAFVELLDIQCDATDEYIYDPIVCEAMHELDELALILGHEVFWSGYQSVPENINEILVLTPFDVDPAMVTFGYGWGGEEDWASVLAKPCATEWVVTVNGEPATYDANGNIEFMVP